MRSVQIAELKNKLSAYLNLVRAGEEVIVNDRKTPIAKIVPLGIDDLDLEEQALIAEGVLRPPKEKFDPDAFFAIGKGIRGRRPTEAEFRRAIEFAREGVDVKVLGHKLAAARVRVRSKKRSR
jgi:prevent-host-death family protein